MARVFLLLFFLSQSASANGVLRWGFGAQDMGTAGAFGGTDGDAISALQINPALLSTLENQWTLSARYLAGSAKFRRSGVTSSLSNDGLYPDFAVSWRPKNSPFTLGLGLSPISALEARWNYLDAPGGIGDISYGNVDHDSRFTAVRLALALSWQVNEEFSLGVSAGVVRSEINFNAPFIFQTNPALENAKVNLDMETDGWAPSFEMGAHYRLTDKWTFGGRIKLPVSLDNSGDAKVDFSAQLPPFGKAAYDAQARTQLPFTIGLGTAWKPNDQWSLGLWIDWHQWSQSYDTFKVNLSDGSDQEINDAIGASPSDRVPLNWQDRFVFSLGTSYQFSRDWTFRVGYRFGKSPIPGRFVTPLNGATLEHALTLGATWQHHDWKLDFSYGYEFADISKINVSGYNSGEYSNSSFDSSIHHISIALGRKF